MSYRVAVVGATGVVGTEMLRILVERGFPASEIVPMASARSRGKTVPIGGEREVTVVELADGNLDGFDIAIFSAGGDDLRANGRRSLPPQARSWSTTLRTGACTTTIPLVVAEVNPDALDVDQGPGSLAHHLQPELLDDADGRAAEGRCTTPPALQAPRVTTMQSVSGTGKAAIDELTRRDRRDRQRPEPARPAQLPAPDRVQRDPRRRLLQGRRGLHRRRAKLINETRKIMSLPDLAVNRPARACRSTSATASRSTSRPSCR